MTGALNRPTEIVKKVNGQVDSRLKAQGEIVLLHDGGHMGFGTDRAFTVDATRKLLERYANKQFVTISGLRQDNLEAYSTKELG